MKSSKTSKFSSSTFSILILISVLFLLSGCARKMAFTRSTVVPAAQGAVKVKKDKNNNYRIELNVMNLAPPDRLTPSKSTYVVWMETASNGSKNIGQLKSSGSFLSNALKSSLKTVSAFEPRSFFVTAEDYADIQYPGGVVVLRTAIY